MLAYLINWQVSAAIEQTYSLLPSAWELQFLRLPLQYVWTGFHCVYILLTGISPVSTGQTRIKKYRQNKSKVSGSVPADRCFLIWQEKKFCVNIKTVVNLLYSTPLSDCIYPLSLHLRREKKLMMVKIMLKTTNFKLINIYSKIINQMKTSVRWAKLHVMKMNTDTQ